MAGSPVRRRLWMAADVLFLLMFVMSVAVQVNDPDSFVWMAIYGVAAIVCLLAILGRRQRWLPMLVALGAIISALSILPRVLGKVPFQDMFAGWEMNDIGVEESREMYGLLLVAAWMLVLAWRSLRAPARSA